MAWERSTAKWVLSSLAAGLFLVGMEEMSWGQMIFNWQTPKLMSDVNVQGESSIHNLWFIHHHTWSIAAVVMSVLFCLAIIGAWGRHSGWLRSRSLADILLPVWCAASYFLIAAISIIDHPNPRRTVFHTGKTDGKARLVFQHGFCPGQQEIGLCPQ